MLGKHTATCRLEGTGDCDSRVGQGKGRGQAAWGVRAGQRQGPGGMGG